MKTDDWREGFIEKFLCKKERMMAYIVVGKETNELRRFWMSKDGLYTYNQGGNGLIDKICPFDDWELFRDFLNHQHDRIKYSDPAIVRTAGDR